MQCFIKKEGKSLIDVENVETTGKRFCHELTNTIEQFIVYVHRNAPHFHLHLRRPQVFGSYH